MRKLKRLLKRVREGLIRRFSRGSSNKRPPGRPPDKGPPLRKITNINVEINMAGDVTLTWDNPTERADGVPSDGSDFEVRVGLKAVGAAGFTPVRTVQGTEPPVVTLANQAGGDYEFELVLFDLTLSKESSGIFAPFSVAVGDLNPLTNVNVTVS